MSSKDEIKQIQSYMEELAKDPVRLRDFLRKVLGRPCVTLEGDEREQILLILHLKEPFRETNNQHSWTSHYMIGDTEYHVTTFPNSAESIVEKILPEDD